MIIPIILAGGLGSRLWPISRKNFPKQFLKIFNGKTFLQETCLRNSKLSNEFTDPIIVANELHKYLVDRQLKEISVVPKDIILEPRGKNTAASMTFSALRAVEDEANDESILMVLPSDHIIYDLDKYKETILESIASAKRNNFSILGVRPDTPSNDYGYIKFVNGEVKEFIEKPDLETAMKFLSDDNFLWNVGIFIVKAKIWLEMIEKFNPETFFNCLEVWKRKTKINNFVFLDDNIYFDKLPSISVDKAVLEFLPKSKYKIVCSILYSIWSDVGNWKSFSQESKDNNSLYLSKNVFSEQSSDNTVFGSNRVIALAGVNNLIIVDTDDALLITDKKQTHLVSSIVNQLNEKGADEKDNHKKTHKPWGWYYVLFEGDGFKVKVIHVYPNESLSLQKHSYRSEHWIVIKGTASIQLKEEKIILEKGQNIYIPQYFIHRLSNFNGNPLEIIEVQLGDYLEEDDIVRIEDKYLR